MTEQRRKFAFEIQQEREWAVHERLMERLRNMTQEEGIQTLVDAGILNSKHELTTHYGGTGEPDEQASHAG